MPQIASQPEEGYVLDPQHELELGGPPQPIEVENAGQAIADRFRTNPPDFVVQWADSSTASLGHVIARELGAVIVHAEDDLGKLIVSTAPPAGSTALIVSIDWTEARGPAALLTMLREHDVHVTAIASVHPH